MFNEKFLTRMREYLKDDYESFLNTLDKPRFQGLRLNPLKTDASWLEKNLTFLESGTPFSKDSWYISGSHGLDPAHIMGLFYLQEPSATSAVTALDVRKDSTVLDLCAAPGSKSTQIAGMLDDGFLVCNEYDQKRAQALLSNLERCGVENFALTNMDGSLLAASMPEMFDRVLVDAPCSGEGMMKKHDAAAQDWSEDNISLCSARQKKLLEQAVKALAPGGIMVYSTCTYAREENEDNVAWLLENFKDIEQVDTNIKAGRAGLPVEGMDPGLVRRIYPMDSGEGHFIAKFRKKGTSEKRALPELKSMKLPAEASRFLKEQLNTQYQNYWLTRKKDSVLVFGMDHPFMQAGKNKVLRQGVFLGEIRKGRFEPAHAFYMAARMKDEVLRFTETSLEDMDRFYHGEQLDIKAEKGFRALCYKGFCYGFGKSDGKRITNKLPKGLRISQSSQIKK